jgi:hypothetical protein
MSSFRMVIAAVLFLTIQKLDRNFPAKMTILNIIIYIYI